MGQPMPGILKKTCCMGKPVLVGKGVQGHGIRTGGRVTTALSRRVLLPILARFSPLLLYSGGEGPGVRGGGWRRDGARPLPPPPLPGSTGGGGPPYDAKIERDTLHARARSVGVVWCGVWHTDCIKGSLPESVPNAATERHRREPVPL